MLQIPYTMDRPWTEQSRGHVISSVMESITWYSGPRHISLLLRCFRQVFCHCNKRVPYNCQNLSQMLGGQVLSGHSFFCAWAPPLLWPAFGAVWWCHSSSGSVLRVHGFLSDWGAIGPHVGTNHLQWSGFQVQGYGISHNSMKPITSNLDLGKERFQSRGVLPSREKQACKRKHVHTKTCRSAGKRCPTKDQAYSI